MDFTYKLFKATLCYATFLYTYTSCWLQFFLLLSVVWHSSTRNSLRLCFTFMLTIMQQGTATAAPATVQTPDSANLKVNQVIKQILVNILHQMLENNNECCFYELQSLLHIRTSLSNCVLSSGDAVVLLSYVALQWFFKLHKYNI